MAGALQGVEAVREFVFGSRGEGGGDRIALFEKWYYASREGVECCRQVGCHCCEYLLATSQSAALLSLLGDIFEGIPRNVEGPDKEV